MAGIGFKEGQNGKNRRTAGITKTAGIARTVRIARTARAAKAEEQLE